MSWDLDPSGLSKAEANVRTGEEEVWLTTTARTAHVEHQVASASVIEIDVDSGRLRATQHRADTLLSDLAVEDEDELAALCGALLRDGMSVPAKPHRPGEQFIAWLLLDDVALREQLRDLGIEPTG